MTEQAKKKGTTTVGIVYKDGVVLAADMRASAGHLAVHKKSKKIYHVVDGIAMTTSGAVSDSRMLYEYLKAELELYTLSKKEKPTIEVATAILRNIIYGGAKGFFPYMVGIMLAGPSEEKGFKLYSIWADGSLVADDYMSIGSGMEIAYGALETSFKEKMTEEQAVVLAAKSVNTALKRDVFSGDGIVIAIVNGQGYKEIDPKKISQILK